MRPERSTHEGASKRPRATSEVADEHRELLGRIDTLETKLRRGRLTVPAYGSASLYFVGMGFYTGSWGPALTMAALTALGGLITLRLRKGWQGRIEALHQLESKLREVEGGR